MTNKNQYIKENITLGEICDIEESELELLSEIHRYKQYYENAVKKYKEFILSKYKNI